MSIPCFFHFDYFSFLEWTVEVKVNEKEEKIKRTHRLVCSLKTDGVIFLHQIREFHSWLRVTIFVQPLSLSHFLQHEVT
jgi:hypothetical protein